MPDDLSALVAAFRQTDAALAAQAASAVNVSLTLRNWCFGCHLTEFEQRGADRADYGARLVEDVSARLSEAGMAGVAPRSLRLYRQFYLAYPGFWQTPSAKSLSAVLPVPIRQTLSATSPDYLADQAAPSDALVRVPHEVVTEGQLEDALLDKLQAFLLELGHGFCFEARQKRLLIGGEHFFVDLVFYHRVLKCHVLIELKNDAFRHEHLGQLNSYVSYYQQHEMSDGDQPPIGLLLCTRKNAELVEYALAGMSNQLFVSRYQMQLPDKEDIAAFLHGALKELGDGDA
ncbi:MAG TPA: PDDEXK nuclease domain-containing protein [Variovorax sp.]|nr:PDDEXK nuclease domain-containing protein [Variovorax sp.]